ncbi:unnamed protein product [Sympodiomycopsis kandeliae]
MAEQSGAYRPRSKWLSKALFLGTGTSAQVPAIHCLATEGEIDCNACRDAIVPGSKNRRGCCSIALIGRHDAEDSASEDQLILIDAGPTFYGSAISHFRPNGVPRRIAGVLLTHGHADAMLGLDNLRAWTMRGVLQDAVDVYLTKETLEVAKGAFPYLIDQGKATGGGGVGALRWNIIDPYKPFTVGHGSQAVEVLPLPVYHGFSSRGGPPFDTLGFRIDSLSYVSDCHHIPPATAKLMAGSECVVIDALMPSRHPSHFSVSQALSLLLSLPQLTPGKPSPSLGILTDLTHRLEHYDLQNQLDAFSTSLKGYAQTASSKVQQFHSKRRGEGSGPRWWASVWDEDRSERTGRIEIDKPSTKETIDFTQLSLGNTSVETSGYTAHVPELKVAWDGMVVDFLRDDGI